MIAIIFSYYGWCGEVFSMLRSLSKNAQIYSKSGHRDNLIHFLVKSRWKKEKIPNIVRAKNLRDYSIVRPKKEKLT